MKHVYAAIMLFVTFVFISLIYVVSLFDDIQNQINNINLKFESVYEELENHDNILDTNEENDEPQEPIKSEEKEEIVVDDLIFESSTETNDLTNVDNSFINSFPVVTEDKKENEIEVENETEVQDNKNSQNDSNSGNNIYGDMADSYYGRLYIPSAGINVALYYGWSQYITDRVDSANIFCPSYAEGFTIADHNNQAFSRLFSVGVGTSAYIEHPTFGTITIVCTDVFYGYNRSGYIMDANGANAMNMANYMMYTCSDGVDGVFISLWSILSMG